MKVYIIEATLKKEIITPNYSKSADMGYFPLGTQERVRNSRGKRAISVRYGTREGTFLFQYFPEKKSKQKELERKSKQ